MTYGIPVLEEARTLMFPEKLDEGRGVRPPVSWKALELLEDGVDARLREESNGVLGVLVEVRIEDPWYMKYVSLPMSKRTHRR